MTQITQENNAFSIHSCDGKKIKLTRKQVNSIINLDQLFTKDSVSKITKIEFIKK